MTETDLEKLNAILFKHDPLSTECVVRGLPDEYKLDASSIFRLLDFGFDFQSAFLMVLNEVYDTDDFSYNGVPARTMIETIKKEFYEQN